MHARSALFDVYGDHLRWRGGVAPVAALVRLLDPLEISVAAVRTGVSRMVRQGWLAPVRLPEGPGYALTERAERRLDEAYARIYRTMPSSGSDGGWDGRWHVLVVSAPPPRSLRERITPALRYLGYAPMSSGVWIGPRHSPELSATLAADDVQVQTFTAEAEGDLAALVARTWDLAPVARAYDEWTALARDLLQQAGPDPDDESAFAVRFRLVHEWRKFLFTDPALPPALLPADWPGRAAAELFDSAAQSLRAKADRFVGRCLDPG